MREQQEQRYSQSILGISGSNPADLAYADIAKAHNDIAGRAQEGHRRFRRGSASIRQEVSSLLQPDKFQRCLSYEEINLITLLILLLFTDHIGHLKITFQSRLRYYLITWMRRINAP